MADKIQFRRDTAARWASVNPILLLGEIGFVTDSVNKYKLGDGVHTWNELPLQGFNGNLVDIPGTDSDSAMSQKGVTDLFNQLNQELNVPGDVYVDMGLSGVGSVTQNENTIGFCSSKDYFPITAGETYTWIIGAAISGGGDNGAFVVYNSNGEIIEYFSANNTSRQIIIPSGGVSARAVFAMGYDNIGVYDSNGNAVFVPNNENFLKKKVITNTKNISSLYKQENGLNTINVTLNKSINGLNNTVIDKEGVCLSDYFPVTEGNYIECFFGKEFEQGGDEAAIVFYDEYDNYLGYWGGGTASKHGQVPQTAVKARASFVIGNDDAGVYDAENNVIFKPIYKDGYQKQINEVNDKIENIIGEINSVSSRNVLLEKGVSDNGDIVENTATKDFCCTDGYFEVTPNETYNYIIGRAIQDGSSNGALVFYDENGVIIEYWSANAVSRVITVPANATKARATFLTNGDGVGIYKQSDNTPVFVPIIDDSVIVKANNNKSNIDILLKQKNGNLKINVELNKSITSNITIINKFGCCLSDYFPVTPNIGFDYCCGEAFADGGDSAAIVFFNSNNESVDSWSANKIARHGTVPAGATKARAGFSTNGKNKIGVYDTEGNALFEPILINGYQTQINEISGGINVHENHGWNRYGGLSYLEGICCSKDGFHVTAGSVYNYVIGGAIQGGSDNGSMLFFDKNGTLLNYYSANATSRQITAPANSVMAKATFIMGVEGVGVYDSNSNPVFIPNQVSNNVEVVGVKINSDVYSRNIDKEPLLIASCEFSKLEDNSKDLQLLLITDTHGVKQAVVNGINATNDFDSIDALVHCGDCLADRFEIGSDQSSDWKDLVIKCKKPFFFIIGNHEKQVYPPILYCPSDEELYNAFIKPSVDAGWLEIGEYEVNKCYYYHDFDDRKVRMIVIDEDEAPLVFDETYWEPITYNSALSNYQIGSTYNQGDEVNVPNYTLYSFRAKTTVTIDAYYNNTAPSYKYARGTRWISQTQAQWFLDTLASTPDNYQVVVGVHRPFSAVADTYDNSIFNEKHLVNGEGLVSYMTTDFIAEAINAFQNKLDFTIQCDSVNSQDMPSYIVSKDFTNVSAKFHSLIGGHQHLDLIWKHRNYNQYQVTPVSGIQTFESCKSDIRRSFIDSLAFDSITVVSFGEDRMGLVKLGQNMTENGNKRDFEVLDIS